MDLDPAILKRARHLRALAERAGTEHEAHAAAKALAGLMARHAIDSVEQIEEDDFEFDRARPLYVGKRIVRWRLVLAQALSEFCGVGVLVQTSPDRRDRRRALLVCGRAGDCERMRHMYAWLASDTERLGRGRGGAAHYWRIGFVTGLGLQLRDARQEARAAANDKALVALDTRRDNALANINERVGPTKVHRTRKLEPDRDKREAFLDGRRTGRQHPLGGQLHE